jgi:hypothetical protein
MQAKCLRGRCLRFREVGALKAHRHSTQTFQGHANDQSPTQRGSQYVEIKLVRWLS